MVQPGEKFGNYEVSATAEGKVAILSETADAVTVRARHAHLGTLAVIKVLHHPRQGRAAFEEEARTAGATAGLLHAHIARVLDFGTEDDWLYRVMEWCEGGSIEDFVKSRGSRPDEAELVEWMVEGAAALSCAHGQNVLHLDLKPSNLLIANDSGNAAIKIADFGFVGCLEDSDDRFQAPEQKSAGAKPTPAADVYSLSAIFAWLMGAKISPGKAEFPSSVSFRWRRLFAVLLADDPAQRPADGSALGQLLRETFAGEIRGAVPWERSTAPVFVPPAIDTPPPLPSAASQPVPLPAPPDWVALPPAGAKPASKKSAAPVVTAALVAVVLLAAGGGYFGWRHFSRPDGAPVVSKNDPAAEEVAGVPEKEKEEGSPDLAVREPVADPAPVPPAADPVVVTPAAEAPAVEVVKDEQPPQIVKVPGDATTLGGALARCPSGGTIEVNGGTYRESLLITRPVTILASGDATLVDDGKSPTLLIAKGDIPISIRGLVLKNSQTQGAGNPEETPALMLVASKAKLKMDKCVIEGGQGDGLTIADGASVELSDCRVQKNRGFGSRISGGSSLTVTRGEVKENGLGGVWASNSGTQLILNEGGAVNRNSNNGIQATEGAVVRINGGGVSFNRTNGIMALDAGTRIEMKESGLVSDNGVNGIAMVNGATLLVSSSKIERNQNYGVLAERAGKVALTGAVFRSNSMAGIFVNEGGGQSCRIERSEFSDHSEFGAAFVDADIFVSGNTFSENGGALLLGKDTKGEISANTISPGPLDSAITREEAGEIKLEKNTVR